MGINNLHDYMGRVEEAVRSNLGLARPLAIVEIEHHEREGYWERAYIVAWVNEKEFGTHRVGIDSKDTAAVMWGHYLKSKEEAMSDLLDRTSTVTAEIERLKGEWRKADDGWIAAREEISKLDKALQLSVCYSPQAIRDSFDGADEDHPDAKWVEEASEEQLLDLAEMIVGSDPTWKDFHSNIEMCIEEMRSQKGKE